MMNKSKILSIISITILSIEALICFTLKLLYYTGKTRTGFFSTTLEASLWTIVSITVTLLPSILILIENTILIRLKKDKRFSILSALLLIFGCLLLSINIVIEIVSLLGSAMCLDSNWTDIAMQMIIFHFSTIIPIALTIISILLRKRTLSSSNSSFS